MISLNKKPKLHNFKVNVFIIDLHVRSWYRKRQNNSQEIQVVETQPRVQSAWPGRRKTMIVFHITWELFGRPLCRCGRREIQGSSCSQLLGHRSALGGLRLSWARYYMKICLIYASQSLFNQTYAAICLHLKVISKFDIYLWRFSRLYTMSSSVFTM